MKSPFKIFSLFFAVLVACIFAVPSCRKVEHSTKPTPGNYRLLGYTVTWDNDTATFVDNYTFYYNSDNRVSMILYTTDDPLSFAKSITFSYNGDSIYKAITKVKTSIVVERDTFIQNSQGQITYAYTPGYINTFEYFGRFLARRTEFYYGSDPTVSVSNTYTSDNMDLLHSGSATVTANFVNLESPVSVDWSVYALGGFTASHTITGLTDHVDNYVGGPIGVTGKDDTGAVHSASYPGGYWFNETFGVWPAQVDRIGDALQIGSFTMYGVNIYQTTHLLKSRYRPLDTTDITYDIDADSKITQTSLVHKDSLFHIHHTIYKLQYQTY